MVHKKALLIILDGWGIGDRSRSDAIFCASTPNLDRFMAKYPNSQLQASGLSVGLPAGIMGNSEVGHLNLGAGRVIYQDLVRINAACTNGDLAKNKNLLQAFTEAKEKKRNLHFIGLISPAGVHSTTDHLYKLCDLAKENGLSRVFIHGLTDGRDSDPQSGAAYIDNLEKHLTSSVGTLASLVGRYYTMDRDQRWERIKKGYDLMVKGVGRPVTDLAQAVRDDYASGLSDEFLEPLIKVDENKQPVALIKEDDVVICFNFRTERLREITVALTQTDLPTAGMKTLSLHYYTLTTYDDKFKKVTPIFTKEKIKNTLGEIIATAGLKQLRLAETEKYAHVTFFFSGGREDKFFGEERILIPSPKVATYDLKPKMSAAAIKEAAIKNIKNNEISFICLNFANGDMVGHTGVYSAIIKAVEFVDTCVGEIVAAADANNYAVLIVADHGNAEAAVNPDGSINTAHSLNPVPCLLINSSYTTIASGVLADVAPTLLKIMNLPQAPEMTGKSLV